MSELSPVHKRARSKQLGADAVGFARIPNTYLTRRNGRLDHRVQVRARPDRLRAVAKKHATPARFGSIGWRRVLARRRGDRGRRARPWPLRARLRPRARHSRDGYSANVARARTPRRARPAAFHPGVARTVWKKQTPSRARACPSRNVRPDLTHLPLARSFLRSAFSLAAAKPAAVKTVRASRAASTRGAKQACRSTPEPSPNASVSVSCSIDDPSTCSLADLEVMYIDALWTYYNGGDFTITDEQYDRLREELNWQGSGFPTLRRYEVQFVEAAISYARGEPVVTDAEYEDLKRKVKSSGKRDDVTALLLYTKGQQLLDSEQFERLKDEMAKLDVEVTKKGATCTLSNTSDKLESDGGTITKMYLALATIPTLIGLVPYAGATVFGYDVPPAFGLGFAATFGLALTAKIMEYTNLQNAEILVGQCPCCEAEIKQFFGGAEPADTVAYKCGVCGTECNLDRKEQLITEAGGLKSV